MLLGLATTVGSCPALSLTSTMFLITGLASRNAALGDSANAEKWIA
jgi:hypothetical protein